jgi:hypothetical protein
MYGKAKIVGSNSQGKPHYSLFERFQAHLQTLKEEHGAVPPYKYLFVVVDYFSRFAWVVPIARKLASLLSEEFSSLLSELPHQPSIVQTDNGGEFRSSFDKLLLAEGIKHIRSKPRKPQTNGAVERLNKTISDKLTERHINKAASGVRWNFTLDLQQIVSNYNATVHSTTGGRPEDLIAETDADVLKLVDSTSNDKGISKKMLETRSMKKEILMSASISVTLSQSGMTSYQEPDTGSNLNRTSLDQIEGLHTTSLQLSE